MERQELQNSIAAGIGTAIQKIILQKQDNRCEEVIKQYEPERHKVTDEQARPKKKVKKDDITMLEEVNRITVALQKLIVNRAASFLVGAPIELQCLPADEDQKTLLAMLEKTWEDNKLNFKSKFLAKHMMAYTECAEIWYVDEVDPLEYWGIKGVERYRMRISVLSPKKGDKLYPVFDMMGNLVAFGRGYEVKVEGRTAQRFDLYTDDKIYYTSQTSGEWKVVENGEIANPIGKIPVIYYSQEAAEWADVQRAIERLETLLSNFADTNDYFGSPMIFAKGTITGFASKGEQGKIITGEKEADIKYLTWESAPESIKLEIETLFDIIYTVTQTPNITFKEMKGLGQLSGVAIKLLFMDAHLKAADKQDDVFGECIQRRINFLKVALSKINPATKKALSMSIIPKFGLFTPNNEKEEIEILSVAAGGKPIMSQRTAVKLNPFVTDVDEEMDLIGKEGAGSLEEQF
ncbi:phage portal protein [Hufsiella ginkgonis]|uniref:Phage portal protein n=1 Tax=Hufsiella ginkgonis TaxID=2695274 RepID=A0A7K1Y0T0_9SPHI|nr:phage portal protein [Hufsiella ginkgonis]MXV16845.1 phage portal protein [Hufsiella ginkgonis]